MRLVYIALLAALSFSTGCPPVLRLPENELLDPMRITTMLKDVQEKRPRVSGMYKARATGIKRFFGSVDLTIAAQQPSSFYVSIPSFFGNAARVVTSDGKHNFILDMTDEGPAYAVEPNNAKSFEKWMGFKIQPREFVYALLGLVDLKGASIVDTTLNARKGIYTVKLRYTDGRECYADFDGRYDSLVGLTMLRDGDRVYNVKYSRFRESTVGRFAYESEVSVMSEQGPGSLILIGDDIKFEDEPFDIDTFQIEKP